MQNIRYHLVNTSAVLLFSFITAATISQFIRLNMNPAFSASSEKNRSSSDTSTKKSYEDYKTILDSNFFKIASESASIEKNSDGSITESGNLSELQLFGTISGPASIARALLRKTGEKESKIFNLWADVYGYKLVRIDNSKIYLQKGKAVEVLDMYAKEDKNKGKDSVAAGKNKQTLSRAEIQQKLLNNVDNAIEGLDAGPNKVNGKIEGYKLKRVSPNNFFYQIGARSGDIIKRINGHPIDSTEKLMGLWQSVQGDSKISIDIDRAGSLQVFELNITD
jgi:general secretion pathway protein C